MNHCYSCTTCKSADKPLECYIAGLPMETSHHRVEGQSVKCGFGLQGVCCRLCSNGPCRITPEAPHGICGASADVIVARNFLRAVAAGSGRRSLKRDECPGTSLPAIHNPPGRPTHPRRSRGPGSPGRFIPSRLHSHEAPAETVIRSPAGQVERIRNPARRRQIRGLRRRGEMFHQPELRPHRHAASLSQAGHFHRRIRSDADQPAE